PLGPWVISRVSGRQIPQQRVLQSRRQNRPRDHYNALSLKTLVLVAPFHSAKINGPDYTFTTASQPFHLSRGSEVFLQSAFASLAASIKLSVVFERNFLR